MFLTFNLLTGDIVGQSVAREALQGFDHIRVDEQFYETLMDNPVLYRKYKVMRKPDGEPELVEFKPLTWSTKTMNLLPLTRADTPPQVEVLVSLTEVQVKFSVLLPEGLEVFAMRDSDPAALLFHEVLQPGAPVPLRLKSLDNITVYATKVAKEYNYGVTLC